MHIANPPQTRALTAKKNTILGAASWQLVL